MQPLGRIGLAGPFLLSWMIASPPALIAQEKATEAQGNYESARREQRQRRFRAMDTNRDGVITRAEWRGNARSFERRDWNRDGVLSGAEVWEGTGEEATAEPGWRERAEREESALARSFRQTDRNADGIISRNEWKSDADTFTRVDANRDGVITRREFLGEGWEAAVVPDQAVGTAGTARTHSPAYQAGYDRGLVDGRKAGLEDKQLRNQWDLEGQRELEEADAGYTDAVGPRPEYQSGYRAGFRVGYRQAFGPR